MSAHLFTVLPAALSGAYLMLRPKGTPVHRLLGKGLYGTDADDGHPFSADSRHRGAQLVGHLGLIHILSFVVLFSVPRAYFAARNHDLVQHKMAMVGVYFGGILIAGAFTLAPGRYLNQLLLG
jgi:uncharacterized membrane protein